MITSFDIWTGYDCLTYRGRVSLSGDGRSLILAPVSPEAAEDLGGLVSATWPEGESPRSWIVYATYAFAGSSSTAYTLPAPSAEEERALEGLRREYGEDWVREHLLRLREEWQYLQSL